MTQAHQPVLAPVPHDLATRARRGLDAATRFTLSTQRADGSWVGTADPRIFDTAVVTYAIDHTATGSAGGSREVRAAKAWLSDAAAQQHHPLVEAIELWLRRLALDPGAAGGVPLSLDGRHVGRAILLHALAVHAGEPTADAAALMATIDRVWRTTEDGTLRQWLRVALIAAEVLAAAALGTPVTADSVAALTAEQSSDGSFCLMPAVTALAHLALDTAAGGTPAAIRCADWLLREQQADGTWRFAHNDIWITALTVRSLRGTADFDRLALPAAADYLRRTQSEDGGWAFKHGLESDCDTTGMALRALAGTPQGTRVWPSAREFARRSQLPDGRWRTWQSSDDHPAPDVTAHMVAGLHAYPGNDVDTARAIQWLAGLRDGEGGWTAEWYSPPAYGVTEFSAAVGWQDRASEDAVADLARQQNADGGWSAHPGGASCAAATGLALTALVTTKVRTSPDVVRRAVEFVVDRQRPDGSWPGVPFMSGPRPLLVHFPPDTHAFTTAGLRDFCGTGQGGGDF